MALVKVAAGTVVDILGLATNNFLLALAPESLVSMQTPRYFSAGHVRCTIRRR